MATKKIAVVIATLAGGGVERMMLNLVESLNLLPDVEAKLVVISDLPAEHPQHQLPDGWDRGIYLHEKRVIFGVRSLWKIIRQEGFTVVISAQEHVNLITSWALRFIKEPIAFLPVVHNTLSIKLGQSRKFGDQVLIPLCRFFYPRFRWIGAVSEGVKENLCEFIGVSPDKVTVIPNPVISHDRINSVTPGSFRGILGVGRLAREKGFDILIQAYARLADEIDLPLMILGEGPEREALEALISQSGLNERISLPGFSSSPWPLMKSAKLFVLPSREEGLPSVLIEALALGTQVVATDCPSGPREILEGGKFGRLVPVDDVAAMAQAMRDALKQPFIEPEKLIEKGLQYSGEASANGYLSVIRRLENAHD